MGRGLSELQRYILREAGKRERVYHVEVMTGFFHFPTVKKLQRNEDGTLRADSGNARNFSPEAIGVGKYRTAKVSLTRACQRLERRGLVQCVRGALGQWAAVKLTEEGRKYVSDNSPLN
jgi:hypothetical protein